MLVTKKRKVFRPGSCREVISLFGCKRENTHYLFALLIVGLILLHHLLFLSTPTRVPKWRTNLVVEHNFL